MSIVKSEKIKLGDREYDIKTVALGKLEPILQGFAKITDTGGNAFRGALPPMLDIIYNILEYAGHVQSREEFEKLEIPFQDLDNAMPIISRVIGLVSKQDPQAEPGTDPKDAEPGEAEAVEPKQQKKRRAA